MVDEIQKADQETTKPKSTHRKKKISRRMFLRFMGVGGTIGVGAYLKDKVNWLNPKDDNESNHDNFEKEWADRAPTNTLVIDLPSLKDISPSEVPYNPLANNLEEAEATEPIMLKIYKTEEEAQIALDDELKKYQEDFSEEISNPGSRDVGAYSGENLFKNVQELIEVAEAFPDQFFCAAAGNIELPLGSSHATPIISAVATNLRGIGIPADQVKKAIDAFTTMESYSYEKSDGSTAEYFAKVFNYQKFTQVFDFWKEETTQNYPQIP